MRSVRRSAVAAAIAISSLLASAGMAQAATWTVTAGTTSSGSTTYVASASGTSSSPALTYTDVTSAISFTCTSSVLKGNLPHLGSGVPNPLATISSSTWTSCTGPLGAVFTIAQVGVWIVTGSSYASPTTTGYLSNIIMNVTGPGTQYSVTGSVDATYSNTARRLSLRPVTGSGHQLTAHVAGGGATFFGLIHDGDTIQITTTTTSPYAFTTPLGALTITSP